MDIVTIEQAITQAEYRWAGLVFKRKNNHEASSSCPFCKQATEDGFLIFEDGGFWCRKCNQSGWLSDNDNSHRLTEAEIQEIRIKRLERNQEQIERRITALERINKERPDLQYHSFLDDEDKMWWIRQGMTEALIDEYNLGICYECPTDSERRTSYTIPVYDAKWKTLKNVRHRLVGATGDKYRPQAAGLGNQLFNSRWVLNEEAVAMVEGEKKSIIVTDRYIPSVGVFGCNGFDMQWLSHFDAVRKLFIAFDPDAIKAAWLLGYDIKAAKPGLEVRIVTLPVKPDDFFIQYGGTSKQMQEYFRMAREVKYAGKTAKQR